MFTDSSVTYDGLGTLQDRFAIRPLNTTNYEFGLPQEFMCDPETGEPAIMNEDGTVTTVSTIFRVKNFIESFSNDIMLYGMGKSDIIINLLSALINTEFLYCDYDVQEKLGKPIEINFDALCQEFLNFVNQI